ncbi:hypothetical protein [Gulosibacter massiliensis]|uniref:hypothetical protein n=1 Tax=Gulosibacter massiliensis TaxID=2479839 RepID=UPI000F62F0D4|nr:hypothetical protein [Gulosibacter massiliensis]
MAAARFFARRSKFETTPVLVIVDLGESGRLRFDLTTTTALKKITQLEAALDDGSMCSIQFEKPDMTLRFSMVRSKARKLAEDIADLLDEVEATNASA